MSGTDGFTRDRKGPRPSQVLLLGQQRSNKMKHEEDEGKAMESRLEAELAEESRPPPKSRLARFRRKGSKLLHSKHVLMAVVVLNLVDCILVLGELILDIHYVKNRVDIDHVTTSSELPILSSDRYLKYHRLKVDIHKLKLLLTNPMLLEPVRIVLTRRFLMDFTSIGFNNVLEKSDISSQKFITQMEAKYPTVLSGHDIDHMDNLYKKIYSADCRFNVSKISERKRRDSGNADMNQTYVDVRDSDVKDKAKKAHAHSIWEKVAHGLHKASIAILGVLFVENLAKIFCAGVEFLSHKLEVFDAVIVLISFTLDLVFLKGLTVYRIQDGIFILSFLVPWRVIRVVNSLIVAVLDHEHFRLKLLYIRNKKISQELEGLKGNERRFDNHIKKIEAFMEAEGIPRWKIVQHTHFNKKQSTLVSMASMAMGGILNGLLEKNAFKGPLDSSEVTKNDVEKTNQNNDKPDSVEPQKDDITKTEP